MCDVDILYFKKTKFSKNQPAENICGFFIIHPCQKRGNVVGF